MVAYEYRCKDCGYPMTLQFPMGEAPEEYPDGEHTLKRLFTAPAIRFRGSGFYSNGG